MHVSQRSLEGSPVQQMELESPAVPPPPPVEPPRVRLKLRYPVCTAEAAQPSASAATTYVVQGHAVVDKQLESALQQERAQHKIACSALNTSRVARAELQRTFEYAQRAMDREMRLALRDMHATVFASTDTVKEMCKERRRLVNDNAYERAQRAKLTNDVAQLQSDLRAEREAHARTRQSLHEAQVALRYSEQRGDKWNERQQAQVHSLKRAADRLKDTEARADVDHERQQQVLHNERQEHAQRQSEMRQQHEQERSDLRRQVGDLEEELSGVRRQLSDACAEAAAAEEAAQEFFGSYQELERRMERAEAEADARVNAHAEVMRSLQGKMSSGLKLPAVPQSWDELSDARVRSKRSEDVAFWSKLLTDSQVRPKDLSTALCAAVYGSATYHEAVFDEKEFWDLRIDFLQEQFASLTSNHWNVDALISLVIDGGFSQHQIECIRRHLSMTMTKNPEGQRVHTPREFLRHPMRGRQRSDIVDVPSPVPPRSDWTVLPPPPLALRDTHAP